MKSERVPIWRPDEKRIVRVIMRDGCRPARE